ncbi:MAG TPA: hypothetical protein DHV36_07140 [Desulfobacteraceae bacterium]|nr:hypothetical protein [Desulfobacteraceae bacterium]
MNHLVCIDDTDMPGTKGTGWLAQELGELITQNSQGIISPISRHQLFVHEDVPYTSHNSAMCFELVCAQDNIGDLIDFMAAFLEERSQKGSDPGLCVVPLDGNLDENSLIAYGRSAKREVLSKRSAYDLAQQLNIHLSEHGGTGQGVVGALAGAGLRLSGNDGRYRGWYHLGLPGETVTLDTLMGYDFIEDLVTPDHRPVNGQTHVSIGSEKTKTVRVNGKQVIVLMENENRINGEPVFRTLTKQEAKQY